MFKHVVKRYTGGPPEMVEHRITLDGEPFASLQLMERGSKREQIVDAWLDREVERLNRLDVVVNPCTACEASEGE